jgi:CRISPR-associated protein (TIGR02584 family)
MSSITLISTIGSSPSVLTETIWKLHEMGSLPAEVIVLTTSHGKSEMTKQLFDSGVWDAMCGHMGISTRDIEFPTRNIHVLKNEDETLSDDLRTYDDCMRFGDLVMEVLRKTCSDQSKTVYVSIAGGRKTMGAQLMSAMQVIGREQDKIFHVLVDDRFETAGFYYPAQAQQMIEGRKGTVTASDAEIELFEVPFIPIGEYSGVRPAFGQSFQSYREQVMADLYAKTFRLTLDPARRVVYIGENQSVELILSARNYMWLLYFALKNEEKGRVTDVTFEPFTKQEDILERLKLHVCYSLASNYSINDDDWIDSKTGLIDQDFAKSRSDFYKNGISKIAKKIGQDTSNLFRFPSRPADKLKANNTLLIPPDRIRYTVNPSDSEEWSDYIRNLHSFIPRPKESQPYSVEEKKALTADLLAFFRPLLSED